MVLEHSVEPVLAKVQAIQQWSVPHSFKALRGFLVYLVFIVDLLGAMPPLLLP